MTQTKRCTVNQCPRTHHANGYCKVHYIRYRDGRPLGGPLPPLPPCKADGCEKPRISAGYCWTHWRRWKNGEDMNAPIRGRLSIEDRLEDLRFMRDNGESLEGAEKRAGMKAGTLKRWLQRQDPELLARFPRLRPLDQLQVRDDLKYL